LTGIGIVAALDAEARTLRDVPRWRGSRDRRDGRATVIVAGIGPAAAAAAAHTLVEAGATALLSWGVAGGLDPRLRPGAIVLPAEVLGPATERYPTSTAWRERERRRLAGGEPVCEGAILSQGTAIADPRTKHAVHRASGAVAIDMESAAIASVAASRGLPFLVVRAIVDAASDELPDAVVDASRDGRPDPWRLLVGLVRSPGDLGALLGLAGRFRIARRALAAVAAAGLAAPS
jgi:adenosylhomocysteine nucleosidase